MQTFLVFLALFLIAVVGGVPIQEPRAARLAQGGHLGCRNEKNEPVDWFIVYKLPQMPSAKVTLAKEGLSYLYMDESTEGWQKSSVSFHQDKHAVAHTLQQLYKSKDNAFHLMYNDETPDGKKSTTKGHAKGVTMFDRTSGFWLLHSVPKFPPADGYSYPEGGQKFGQTLICISFEYENLGTIADQLLLYEPFIYSSALPPAIAKDYESLTSLINEEKPSTLKRESKLRSSGGVTFTSFAKSGKWGDELYADLVAPSLKESLYVESWQNGRGDLPSSCKGTFHVMNIAELQFDDADFKNSKDHSKWAVSSSKSGDWICIGGINRQHGQLSRGGGTMCMKNKNVWQSFYEAVKNTESCDKE